MKIKNEIRNKIIEDYQTGQFSYANLAKKYGVSGTSIGRIVNPDYLERERAKNRIRQRTYEPPKPLYSVNLRFYEQDQDILDAVKSVDNIQTYVKDLIRKDVEK